MRNLSGQLAQAAQVGVGLARGRVITAQDAAGGCAVAAVHGALDHHGRRARAQDEVRDVRLCCAGQAQGCVSASAASPELLRGSRCRCWAARGTPATRWSRGPIDMTTSVARAAERLWHSVLYQPFHRLSLMRDRAAHTASRAPPKQAKNNNGV